MANYGDKYISSFTDTDGKIYDVAIAVKDYVGATHNILLGAVPVLHSHEVDEAKPAIKGSSVKLTYINQDSQLPLSNWYSEDDTYFRLTVTLQQNSQVVFTGFLVQDDSSEDLVDYDHEVTLSFNDGLGLLKDIPLNQNLPAIGITASVKLDFVAPIPANYVYLYNTGYIPTTSSSFSVSGHIDSSANTTFSPTAVTYLGDGNYKCEVPALSFATDTVAWRAVIAGAGNIDLYRRNTLIDLIRICLYNTGLELDTWYLVNLFEEAHNTDRVLFEQTYIDTKTFLEKDKWKSCWDVLEAILSRFGCTLFQANGKWVVIRWDEARYTVPFNGFVYDSDMQFDPIQTASLTNVCTWGFNQSTYPETAPLLTLIRPYKFAKETFNYVQPEYILYNNDLQVLGSLITSYSSGSNMIYEYEATGFYAPSFSPTQDFFIRVTEDSTGTEISRKLVISGATSDMPRSVVGTPFEVSEGDRVTVSFTMETNKSQAGGLTEVLALGLYDGTSYKYPDETTKLWGSGLSWSYYIGPGDNTNEPHAPEIDPNRVPNDGIFYVFFPQAVFGATSVLGVSDETWITDIRVTYEPLVNDSTKAIGHVHTDTRDGEIKNKSDETITTDDSPRNSIAGTLFLPDFSGIIQIRTSKWYRLTELPESKKLGEIRTSETLIAHGTTRNKIEGTFYGLYQNGYAFSQLAAIQYDIFPGFYFIPGRTEIDYRNNKMTATIYEILAETEDVITETYDFKYLYKNE